MSLRQLVKQCEDQDRELQACNNEIDLLRKELKEKKSTDVGNDGSKMSMAEFQQMKNEMNNLMKQRQQLQSQRAEFGVLQRTADILRNKMRAAEDYQKQIEKRHGIEGYSAAADSLEAISRDKINVDKQKESVLEDMSRVVKEINEKINEVKNRMNPSIVALRALRAEQAGVEEKYNQAKNGFDNAKAGYEGQVADLERQISVVDLDG
mgnify:CR=1 FL=1